MTTDNTSPIGTPTEAPARRGFGPIVCPKCLASESINLSLDDLDSLCCTACEESYSLDDVRALVADWTKILAWVDLAPVRSGECPF